MPDLRVAVVGAGVAGLAATMDLARAGARVTLFERATAPGGKLRELDVAGARIDAGPTVFTMREIFDELFADAGDNLDAHLTLTPADILARHAWNAETHLDLFADFGRSIDSIAAFAGTREARGFVRFAANARRIFRTLERSFIRSSRPNPFSLAYRIKFRRLADLWRIQPFVTFWNATGRYFNDPRLRQLFGRYATYCGSSPFLSPATLMLVAHVEQSGVWYVTGGMHGIALQMAAAAQRLGATIRYSAEIVDIKLENGRASAVQLAGGECLAADAIVFCGDTNALATGLLGTNAAHCVRPTVARARSLSAITWNLLARTSGFELKHHTVFFSTDTRGEFDDVFRRGRLPLAPTVYVCAQDRCDGGAPTIGTKHSGERLFFLVNAPAIGDNYFFSTAEAGACETRVIQRFQECGLKLQSQTSAAVTTPTDFERLFPATGGALYGPASHGWMASFRRPGSRSALEGLYLAGGSTHPGPGLPMAAISGRLAAARVMADWASTHRSRATAMPGGISMR